MSQRNERKAAYVAFRSAWINESGLTRRQRRERRDTAPAEWRRRTAFLQRQVWRAYWQAKAEQQREEDERWRETRQAIDEARELS